MELITQIIGLVTALLSLGVLVFNIFKKQKDCPVNEKQYMTNIKSSNNSTVINGSMNTTIINNTTRNETRHSTSSKSSGGIIAEEPIGSLLVIFVLAVIVTALYLKFQILLRLITNILFLILGLLFLYAVYKNKLNKNEIALTVIGIFTGISSISLFRNFYLTKFVVPGFIEQTVLNMELTELVEYLIKNKPYLYFNVFEVFVLALAVINALFLLITIFNASYKQKRFGNLFNFIVVLLPLLLFIMLSFMFYINPHIFNGLN